MFYQHVRKYIRRLTRNFNNDNYKSKNKGHNLWMKITIFQGYSKILMGSFVTVKLNWTWDINSLRIRDAPRPENGYQPCSNKGTIQSHSAVRRESAMDNRTPNNWYNAIQNVRRSNDRHTKSIPAETGRKTHKKLNINFSQIFPIEVGCAKVWATHRRSANKQKNINVYT